MCKRREYLFLQYPELSLDMHRSAKNWNGTKPWAAEHRASCMLQTTRIDEAWETWILQGCSREEINEAADEGCIASMLELEHLGRSIPE